MTWSRELPLAASKSAQRRYLGPCLEIGPRASVAPDCLTRGHRPVFTRRADAGTGSVRGASPLSVFAAIYVDDDRGRNRGVDGALDVDLDRVRPRCQRSRSNPAMGDEWPVPICALQPEDLVLGQVDAQESGLDLGDRHGLAVDADRGQRDSRVRGERTRPQLGLGGAVALKGAALSCPRGHEDLRKNGAPARCCGLVTDTRAGGLPAARRRTRGARPTRAFVARRGTRGLKRAEGVAVRRRGRRLVPGRSARFGRTAIVGGALSGRWRASCRRRRDR